MDSANTPTNNQTTPLLIPRSTYGTPSPSDSLENSPLQGGASPLQIDARSLATALAAKQGEEQLVSAVKSRGLSDPPAFKIPKVSSRPGSNTSSPHGSPSKRLNLQASSTESPSSSPEPKRPKDRSSKERPRRRISDPSHSPRLNYVSGSSRPRFRSKDKTELANDGQRAQQDEINSFQRYKSNLGRDRTTAPDLFLSRVDEDRTLLILNNSSSGAIDDAGDIAPPPKSLDTDISLDATAPNNGDHHGEYNIWLPAPGATVLSAPKDEDTDEEQPPRSNPAPDKVSTGGTSGSSLNEIHPEHAQRERVEAKGIEGKNKGELVREDDNDQGIPAKPKESKVGPKLLQDDTYIALDPITKQKADILTRYLEYGEITEEEQQVINSMLPADQEGGILRLDSSDTDRSVPGKCRRYLAIAAVFSFHISSAAVQALMCTVTMTFMRQCIEPEIQEKYEPYTDQQLAYIAAAIEMIPAVLHVGGAIRDICLDRGTILSLLSRGVSVAVLFLSTLAAHLSGNLSKLPAILTKLAAYCPGRDLMQQFFQFNTGLERFDAFIVFLCSLPYGAYQIIFGMYPPHIDFGPNVSNTTSFYANNGIFSAINGGIEVADVLLFIMLHRWYNVLMGNRDENGATPTWSDSFSKPFGTEFKWPWEWKANELLDTVFGIVPYRMGLFFSAVTLGITYGTETVAADLLIGLAIMIGYSALVFGSYQDRVTHIANTEITWKAIKDRCNGTMDIGSGRNAEDSVV